jgi:16S rRNA (guanine(966)-N(2))-methyltransferase RsmD
MRVIAGSARRLQLVTPKGMNTRPTSDKVKETLFNILSPVLYDVNFLDLFAGSGGIGIEALSRGASGCTFIEKDKEASLCIRKNLETTHFTDVSNVYQADVMSALSTLVRGSKFDIVFMDPPYDQGLERSVLSILGRSDIIDEDTLVICEAGINTDMSFTSDLGFEITRIKDYKKNKHVFMKRRNQ